MDFWIILISAVAVMILIPYVKSLIVRVVMSFKLFGACKKYVLKLYGEHPFWIFASYFVYDELGALSDRRQTKKSSKIRF